MIDIATKKRIKKYTCLICGENKGVTEFYKSRNKYMWKRFDNKCLICKQCVNELYDELKGNYSEEEALLGMCSMLGVPFLTRAIRSFYNQNSPIIISKYLTYINTAGHKTRTFLDSMLVDMGKKSDCVNIPQSKTVWSKSDKKNKAHVLDTLGFDPFDSADISDGDKKYCFNILSNFCDIDGISLDPHKLQSVIQLTYLHLQVHQMDEQIAKEQNKTDTDYRLIKEYVGTKKDLVDTIAKVSKDNSIGAQYNADKNKGSNTFTGKMKKLNDEALLESKVNLFDIETCKAMQQIADINMQSILEQLELDDSDYAKMIATMREEKINMTAQYNALEEENRNLKNRIRSLGYEC